MVNHSKQIIFFTNQSDFRKWLEKNHDKMSELLVGFYKAGSGKPSMTWSQSVDEAICFGWIDGVRKSIDDESYCIRFTPRKPRSIWSAVNIKKVEALIRQELMHSAGLSAFSKREENRSAIYAYEREAATLSNDFINKFKSNRKAWIFFKSLAPSYQRTAIHWVMSAKQETTKAKRIDELIRDSEAAKKIKSLNY
ncbi:MAG: YdeI/OmpD-associated family protein [Bacteroidota bacterium]|nr:YdeI/OmpD-associated family protein [Bacteroidota bacterium]